MLVFLSISHPWAASLALVGIFFLGIPALLLALALFAAVQARGERAPDLCPRGRRSDRRGGPVASG